MIVTQHKFTCPCCQSTDRVYIINYFHHGQCADLPAHECRNCGAKWMDIFDPESHKVIDQMVLDTAAPPANPMGAL